ncbi:MAG: hypothetical protein COA69_09525 [Robiginitomaculum sp.]|nr:MAG: hypothetical protein COA69_09525 [Robiginitomaculum sp.]
MSYPELIFYSLLWLIGVGILGRTLFRKKPVLENTILRGSHCTVYFEGLYRDVEFQHMILNIVGDTKFVDCRFVNCQFLFDGATCKMVRCKNAI